MSRIRPMKFVQVVYRTRRFEQMVRWYQIVFDAKVRYQNPALAFLTYDGEHHGFAFANLDILKPGGTESDRRVQIGVDHVAYTYASLKETCSRTMRNSKPKASSRTGMVGEKRSQVSFPRA